MSKIERAFEKAQAAWELQDLEAFTEAHNEHRRLEGLGAFGDAERQAWVEAHADLIEGAMQNLPPPPAWINEYKDWEGKIK